MKINIKKLLVNKRVGVAGIGRLCLTLADNLVNGIYGAKSDSRQASLVVEAMRHYG